MAVVANEGIAYTVADAVLLPYLCCGIHGDKTRLVGQPYLCGVAKHQQSTWAHHRSQLMMVVGKVGDILASVFVLQFLHEPVVVGTVETLHTRITGIENILVENA